MSLSIGDFIIDPENDKTYKVLKINLTSTGFLYWLELLDTETGVVYTTTIII